MHSFTLFHSNERNGAKPCNVDPYTKRSSSNLNITRAALSVKPPHGASLWHQYEPQQAAKAAALAAELMQICLVKTRDDFVCMVTQRLGEICLVSAAWTRHGETQAHGPVSWRQADLYRPTREIYSLLTANAARVATI